MEALAIRRCMRSASSDWTSLYTFGLSTNEVLKRESEALLAEAVRLWETTSEPQRLFDGFWYQERDHGPSHAGWWSNPKRMHTEPTDDSW